MNNPNHDSHVESSAVHEESSLIEESSVTEDVKVRPAGVSIEISIRLPDKRICIKCCNTADCTELAKRFEIEGYPLSNYELIRAYPRQKINISPGITIDRVPTRQHVLSRALEFRALESSPKGPRV